MKHALCALALIATAVNHAPDAGPVDLVLVLATDTSLSISTAEYEIQRTGILNALRDPAVAGAIAACAPGGVALSYAEWAGPESFRAVVPLRRVSNGADLRAFADEMEGHGRALLAPGTDPADALLRARQMINAAPFTSRRRVIDLSGDGIQNTRPDLNVRGFGGFERYLRGARDRVVGDNIEVNGLAIERHDRPGGYADLGAYFVKNLSGGRDAFVVSVDSFDEMHARLRQKLSREICGGSVPGT